MTIGLEINLNRCIFQRWNDHLMLISAINRSGDDQGTPRFLISFRRTRDHCSCQILLSLGLLKDTYGLFKG